MANDAYKKDRLIAIFIALLAILVAVIPIMMLWDIIKEGLPFLSFNFLSENPTDAGRSGGILSIILSTLSILAVCLSVVVPLGLGCALYLSEFIKPNSFVARVIGLSLDILGGVPSIVFGLFGYAVFVIQLGLGFSILSGGLSLAFMVLPLFVRTAEHALRACPQRYRQTSLALDISHIGFITRILLPTSLSGIMVALILSIARALAETAVLIFTAGYVTRTPESFMDSGRSLSVHIYDLSMNVPGGQGNAAATAIVLVIMIISINLLARFMARHWQSSTL